MRAPRPCASCRGDRRGRDAGDSSSQVAAILCELGNETELTTVFRLAHDGPFTVRLPEVAGLAVLPPGGRPDPLSPSARLLGARLDAEHPGWDV